MPPDATYLTAVTVLRRARNGNTYHRADCARALNTVPWIWAEGRSRAEVEATLALGVKPCKVCDPLGALTDAS